ncbi:MAG TPA: PAS domain S-box protein [Chryseolinea sp.]|nr:PAS domain S-box protein [Chryseolinea sp.]HPH45423.1 PAS domain S-box protein [Chryseolinea sp.]HPM28754.1 PAS domain S-box protein [Chryseolinea sp.]
MPKEKKTKKDSLSEQHFRALIENAHDGIVLYDATGKIIFYSASAKKISGYADKEALGKLGSYFIHPEDIEETREVFHRVLKNPGKSISVIQRLRHNKGHYFWSESLLTNFLHKPDINGIVSNFRDITDKKLAEEKEKDTRILLESINENMTEGLFMGVVGDTFKYANQAFLELSGYRSFKELQKVKPKDLYVREEDRIRILEELAKNGSSKNQEVEFKRKNGSCYWTSISMSFLKNQPNYYVGTVRNITKEREFARKESESKAFLNNIINTVAAPIFVKDEKHRWLLYNDSFCSLNHCTREELLGKSDYDFHPPEEAKIFWKNDNHVLKTGDPSISEETLTLRGETRHLLTTKTRYVNEQGDRFVIGCSIEITAIKKVEEELNKINASLQGIMESTKESIYAVDNKFQYLSFNENHSKIMKDLYKANIEIGMNKLTCFNGAEDVQWVKNELTKALKGEHFISEHQLNYPKFKGFIETTFNPIRDRLKQVKGVAVFVKDITERRDFEEKLKSLNDTLVEQNAQLASRENELRSTLEELSERNFELDQLMYKTSHDLRSPLSSIMGLVNLANLEKDGKNFHSYLNKIEDRIKKLDEFIKSMLSYAKVNRTEVEYSSVELETVALNCLHELEYLDNFSKVLFDLKIKGKEILFRGDEQRIHIIFSNIISNAFKYFNPEVKSFLKIRINVNKHRATIEISDNGIGIKTEHLDKIFNMFYRATDRSQGSGLGMYIVKQAIEKCGGEIDIESTYGLGTHIKISLPNG